MADQQFSIVAGVDGCRAGWICFLVDTQSRKTTVEIIGKFASLLALERAPKIIAVDIPIGLADAESRPCDIEARRLLGKPRSNSVFPAPVRPALQAEDYIEACQLSRSGCGKALSKQTFAIIAKIREVDSLMMVKRQNRIFEVHPEVSFWALNGEKPMRYNKRLDEGRKERLQLVLCYYPAIEVHLSRLKRKEAKPDDLLDAAAAAWTAERIAQGRARCVSQSVEVDSRGVALNIFY